MRHDLAVCLYFATYLSPLNPASQRFVSITMQGNEDLMCHMDNLVREENNKRR